MTMRRMLLFVTFELAVARSGFGQDYTIQTIAGGGWDIPGVSANLSSLQGVAIDRAGNLFMALSAYSVVVRMDTTGQLSLVAGINPAISRYTSSIMGHGTPRRPVP